MHHVKDLQIHQRHVPISILQSKSRMVPFLQADEIDYLTYVGRRLIC